MNGEYEDDHDDRVHDDAPRANQLVRRSFEGISTLVNNAATQALTAKATADINARWMIAMHRPRSVQDARVEILRECSRPDFAKSAIYAVPRGGSTIKGLSIRFAEAMMSAMTNMGQEAQTLYDSDDARVVRVTVTDYESNTAWSRDITIPKTKEVKQLRRGMRPLRERVNSYGDTVYIVEATNDDVVTMEASAISKASRTGILRQVPAWLLAEAREMCERVQQDKAAKDPDAERRKMFDAFAHLNVKPSWLGDWLGHAPDAATPAEVVELQQLYRAIRDGETTPDDALRARRGGEKPERATGGVASAVAKPGSKRGQAVAAQAGYPPVLPDEATQIARDEAERARREGR